MNSDMNGEMNGDDVLKKVRNFTLALGTIYTVLGILFIIWPETMNVLLGYLLGAFAFGLGIYFLVLYFTRQRLQSYLATYLFIGIFLVIFGFIALLYQGRVLTYSTFVFGCFLLIGSTLKMQNAIILQKIEHQNWWLVLILGLISIIFAVLIIVKPKFISGVYLTVFGVFLLYDGLTLIGSAGMAVVFLRQVKKGVGGWGHAVPPEENPTPGVQAADASLGAGSSFETAASFGAASASQSYQTAQTAQPASFEMNGVPEPEKKKKFSFFDLFKKKKAEAPEGVVSNDAASAAAVSGEVISPAPAAEVEHFEENVEDAEYHPLNEDPFSNKPSNDAAMAGVSFEAVPGQAFEPESDPLPELKPDTEPLPEQNPETDPLPELSPESDPLPELKPEPEPESDPLPELTPDPVTPGEEISKPDFDPETGKPLDVQGENK